MVIRIAAVNIILGNLFAGSKKTKHNIGHFLFRCRLLRTDQSFEKLLDYSRQIKSPLLCVNLR